MIHLGIRQKFRGFMDLLYFRRKDVHASRWNEVGKSFPYHKTDRTRTAWYILAHGNKVPLAKLEEDLFKELKARDDVSQVRTDTMLKRMFEKGAVTIDEAGNVSLVEATKGNYILRDVDGLEFKYYLLLFLAGGFTWAFLSSNFDFMIFSVISILLLVGNLVDDYLRSTQF